MGAGLISIAFTTFASAMSLIMTPVSRDTALLRGVIFRIVLAWIAVGTVAFIGIDRLIGFGLIALILVLVAPFQLLQRVYFYIGCFAALPTYYIAPIPFPGLNYLIDIEFGKLAAIIVLGPVFIAKIAKPPAYLRSVDRLLFLFCALTGLMAIRDLPFTSMLRALLDQFFLVVVPYVAISRTLTNREEIEGALQVLFASFLILAFIAMVSVVRQWNYYANIGDVRSKMYTEYRNGILRVYATLSTPLLGYLMGVGLVLAAYFRERKLASFLFALGFAGLFAFVCFATGSRGGYAATISTVCAYVAFRYGGRAMRGPLIWGTYGIIFASFAYLARAGVGFGDQYGTFEYRTRLLRASLPQIAERPLFGSANFMEKPAFEALRQGEGIVDLVNAYLQIALYYGLVGLVLFVGAQWTALNGTVGALSAFEKAAPQRSEEAGRLKALLAVLAAANVGFLIMIATTSAVSYTWNYSYLTLALLAAYARVARSAAAAPAAVAADAPVSAPAAALEERESVPLQPAARDSDARPLPEKRPYGARFVRSLES